MQKGKDIMRTLCFKKMHWFTYVTNYDMGFLGFPENYTNAYIHLGEEHADYILYCT